MEMFPLFIEGEAFHLYSQLSDSDKKKEDAVQKSFATAFSMTPAKAYSCFKDRCLRVDESPDAYVADLKRLLGLSGHKVSGDKDPVLFEQLLAGLTPEYSRQIRLTAAGKELKVSDCLESIRALRATEGDSKPGVTAAAAGGGNVPRSVMCFICKQMGHVKKNCPQRRSGNSQSSEQCGAPSSGGVRVCHFCDQPGHFKRDCTLRKKWMESHSQPSAAAAEPTRSAEDTCLCTVPSPGRQNLPKVYVDVAVDGGDWCRVRSVIDTGSTKTLVTIALVERVHAVLEQQPEEPILALDGKPLQLLGRATMKFVRNDGPVSIHPVTMSVLVVPELSVVGTEVLIGSDMVATCGGLKLDYDHECSLSAVVLGSRCDVAAATSVGEQDHPLRHVSAETDGDDIVLSSDDGSVRWDSEHGRWVLKWKWKDGHPPSASIGPGIGEYSRAKLTATEEELFGLEVQTWIDSGWLVPHDDVEHGEPACVLPLLAVVQPHKPTTPVRPCLDYRMLNKLIESSPGLDAPACSETLRSWRKSPAGDFQLVDLSKAYLQVHVHPELQRYQVVLWQGKPYVMTRVGFGMNIAPKFMDIIIRYVTRGYPEVDNYVDDLRIPTQLVDPVTAALHRFGLPTKPAEHLPNARVLGLQLSTSDDRVMWHRRDGVKMTFDLPLTKRKVFQWCGRLTSHYPVAGWLRPSCSMVKRLATLENGDNWDDEVSPELLSICQSLQERVSSHDPVRGVWQVNGDPDAVFTVWCDASDLALGVAIEVNGDVIEDSTEMRDVHDKHHINVAELEAAVKGIKLALIWKAKRAIVKTDSKTVFSWLRQVVNNVRSVKTSGLSDLLIQHRLQAIADLIDTFHLDIVVEWVPSAKNCADQLTRVPDPWIARSKFLKKETTVADSSSGPLSAETSHGEFVAAVSSLSLPCPVSHDDIVAAQSDDATIQSIIDQLQNDMPIPEDIRNVRQQLVVKNGVLFRCVKLTIEGVVTVIMCLLTSMYCERSCVC